MANARATSTNPVATILNSRRRTILICLLLLPLLGVLVPLYRHGGIDAWVAWQVYFSAHLGLWLANPFTPRPPDRRSIPLWTFWLGLINSATGAAALGVSTSVMQPLLVYREIHVVCLELALLTLVVVALPRFLRYGSTVLGKAVSPARLYTSLLVLGSCALLIHFSREFGDDEEISRGAFYLLQAIVVLVPLVAALLHRRGLWSPSGWTLWPVLSQVGWWTLFGGYLLRFPEPSSYAAIVLLSGAIAAVVSILVWPVLRLRFSPVRKLGAVPSEEALSIQTNPRLYVDTNMHGRRLLNLIRRSDGGVIGITGVRGAGKSALAAHVATQLRGERFVLSMTAPIRHDPGIGFLTTLCRAVCRQVLDNIEPGLRGTDTEESRARREIVRRLGVLAVILAAGSTLVIAGIQLLPTPPIVRESDRSPSPDNPALYTQLDVERGFVADLLQKIEQAMPVDTTMADVRRTWRGPWLLVPESNANRFRLLPTTPKVPVKQQLERVASALYWPSDATVVGYPMPDELQHFAPHVQAFLERERPKATGRVSLFGPSDVEYMSETLYRMFHSRHTALYFKSERLLEFYGILSAYGSLLGIARDEGSGTAAEPPRLRFTLIWWLPVVLLVLASLPPLGQRVFSLGSAIVNWRFLSLHREANDFLESLSYSESRETARELSMRGLTFGAKRSLAARDLTLPGLTARFLEFARSVRRHFNDKLIIAIDELDKVHDPEMIKALLTEIKGAVFAPGCFYLISISEDAARSFRHRLSSGRDIFESTFDEVIEISQLNSAAVAQILQVRQSRSLPDARIPDRCTIVLTLFGGGIPREIVRSLRVVVEAHSDCASLEPSHVATFLMRQELSEWLAHLGESSLSGEDAIRASTGLGQALSMLSVGGPGPAERTLVFGMLDGCLELIDNKGLRMRLATLLDSTADQVGSLQRVAVRDIQECLRLMLLATVWELVVRDEASVGPAEPAVLDAYRVLADKPALAERTIVEIRERAGLPRAIRGAI